MILSSLFLICIFKDKILAENWTKLAENLKKIKFFRILTICFLQLCYKTVACQGQSYYSYYSVVRQSPHAVMTTLYSENVTGDSHNSHYNTDKKQSYQNSTTRRTTIQIIYLKVTKLQSLNPYHRTDTRYFTLITPHASYH